MRIVITLTIAVVTSLMISACAVEQTTEEAVVASAPTFTPEEIEAMSTEEKLEIYNRHAEEKQQLVCKQRKKTGSHFRVTECRTLVELQEEKDAADRFLYEANKRSTGVQRQ